MVKVVGVAWSRAVVVRVAVTFVDGYPERKASLRRSRCSLVRLEGDSYSEAVLHTYIA